MLPYMSDKISKKALGITKFSGLNQTQSRDENELVSSVNMSVKDYPCISVRKE